MAHDKDKPLSEDQLIVDFRNDYEDALRLARIQAEHTATAGWRSIVTGFHESQKIARQGVVSGLRATAQTILDASRIGEMTVKAIGSTKATAEAVRISQEGFDRDTIDPVRVIAQRPAKLINDYRQQAKEREEKSPLVDGGLVATFASVVAELPVVTWDEDTCVVTVKGGFHA